MNYVEHAHAFECEGETLIAISSVPDNPVCTTGVLVIVGGPQYRVGSHRQFVHLCRNLAKRGIPCMRFDVRGMGDSSGEKRAFDELDNDVGAAAHYFRENVPGIDRVILWGLCDGASATCLYAPLDPNVAGLILLNPWVRTESIEAKTYLKHYYLKRFFEPAFWKKLGTRQVAIRQTASNILRSLRLSRDSSRSKNPDNYMDLPSRMAAGVERAKRPLLLILSRNDFVANEFELICKEHQTWRTIMADATVKRLENADHTFSTAEWRDDVAELTAAWVQEIART